MSQPPSPALLQAMALFRAPRSARPGSSERLPPGVLQLIRIVAGDEQALTLAQQATSESQGTLREAATFYIQQVLFAAGSNSYRVLGVDADAIDEQLREHYRWLARWLHPDRNANDWESVYADRVNRAWQDVRTAERRQRFDQESQAERANVSSTARLMPSKLPRAVVEPTTDVRAWLRWLPSMIFGGLGVSAVLAVSFFYALRWAEQGPVQSSRPVTAAAIMPLTPPASATATESTPRPPVPVADTMADGNQSLPRTSPAAPMVSQAAPGSARVISDRSATAKVESPTSVPVVVASVQTEPMPARQSVAATEKPLIQPTKVLTNLVAEMPLPPPSVVAATPPPSPPVPIVTAATLSPDSPPDPIDDDSAHDVIGAFSDAYVQGDLARMRRLFTDDAHDAHGGLDGILSDYNRVFSDSQQRSLDVSDVSWLRNGNTATIIASYQATVVSRRDGRPRRVHGDLRLDLRLEGGQLRIYRLLHDENPG